MTSVNFNFEGYGVVLYEFDADTCDNAERLVHEEFDKWNPGERCAKVIIDGERAVGTLERRSDYMWQLNRDALSIHDSLYSVCEAARGLSNG